MKKIRKAVFPVAGFGTRFLPATKANVRFIRETLEAAGIEFIGEPGEGPGVRLWKKPN